MTIRVEGKICPDGVHLEDFSMTKTGLLDETPGAEINPDCFVEAPLAGSNAIVTVVNKLTGMEVMKLGREKKYGIVFTVGGKIQNVNFLERNSPAEPIHASYPKTGAYVNIFWEPQ